ncbi:MAG TPA: hypothetical protein VMN36_06040 [Verrucomicrobiales bacterium]|nr:hypothetical protein [Verrucomicrobiales bacterium]
MVGMLCNGGRTRWMLASCAVLVLSLGGSAWLPAREGEVVETLMDFENPNSSATGALTSFRWSDELEEWRGLLSGRERVEDPDAPGNHALRLWVHDAFPWTSESDPGSAGFWLIEFYDILSLLNGFIPPEADALRIRVKPIRGQFRFCLWQIPLTMATGDAYTDLRVAHALEAGQGWQTIDFPLNHDLQRNFRRRDWSLNSPSTYFTRWIQEVLHVSMVRLPGAEFLPLESAATEPERYSELLLDDLQFVNLGEGAPFLEVTEDPVRPVQIAPEEIEEVVLAADFEGGERHGRAVTLTLQPAVLEGVEDDGTGGYLKPRYFYAPGNSGGLDVGGDGRIDTAWHLPATLSEAAEGSQGIFPGGGAASLRAVMKGYESQSWFGVEMPGTTEANAVELLVKMSHPQIGLDRLVVDLLGYTTPVAERNAFPHDALGRPSWSPADAVPEDPAVWREVTANAVIDGQTRVLRPLNFDYFFDQPRTRGMAGLSYAFYHARRIVNNGEWSRLVIPLADFQCAWGQRSSEPRFMLQQALDPAELILLVMTSPWRQLRRDTEFLVDSIRLVRIPVEGVAHRSYWQHPDVSVFGLRREDGFVLHSGLWRQIREDLSGELPRLSLAREGGGVSLSQRGPAGLRYLLEYSSDPGIAPWETIAIDRITGQGENALRAPAGESGYFRGSAP